MCTRTIIILVQFAHRNVVIMCNVDEEIKLKKKIIIRNFLRLLTSHYCCIHDITRHNDTNIQGYSAAKTYI